MHLEQFPQFVSLLTGLAEFFPASKINIAAVSEGYFEDLAPLTLDQVSAVLTAARRTCTYFPTVAELLTLAGTGPGDACAKCPTGHGLHTGHQVAHYPAGPWCKTCQADMHTPSGYSYARPQIRPALPTLRLAHPPLSAEAVHDLVTGIVAHLGETTPQPKMTIAERKALLRRQAEQLLRDDQKDEQA